MSDFNWRAVIEQVKNGEAVDEIVANRALVALAERTDWLKGRLEQLDTTSGKLTLSSVAVDTTVSGGDWVYYDAVDGNYKQALAGLEFNATLGTYLPTVRSMVAGLVLDKISPTLGVVLIVAEGIKLSAEPDIANMQVLMQGGETFSPGRHFLSHVTPGKMTGFPAGAPLIPLGVFGEESSTVRMDIRDAFDSHYHRRFELHAVPAASNNLAESGWADDGSISWVDHYYLAGNDSSLIALAHRRNTTKIPDTGQRRVDLKKDTGTGKLKITLHTDVDPEDPTSVDSAAVSKLIDWPAYGEEVVIDYPADGLETDLIVAFIRRDWANGTRYANTLAVDIAGLPAGDITGTWKVNLPTDYHGWANANPFRDEVPAAARLRYISEGHYDLFEAFPPIPVEGALLYKDGIVAAVNSEYIFSYFDLFWVANNYFATALNEVPWPYDFDRDSAFVGSKDLQLTFVQNPLGPTETIVKCLTSVSNLLEITQLGGNQKASTGALQIALKLALAIKSGDPIISDTMLASIDSESRFVLGKNVAELIAGPNTKLTKINTDGSEDIDGPFVGKVRVEAVIPTQQGEAVGIALFNAKESEKNGVIYTEFLRPTVAKTAMVARIKIPNFNRGDSNIRFRLYAQFLGEAAADADYQGIFKVEYRIVRSGVNVSSGLAAPARIEAWRVPFLETYVPFTILGNELPVYDIGGGDVFEKQPIASPYNLYADDLIEPNDIISVRMERVANSTQFNVGDAISLAQNSFDPDDYPGNIGIVGLRWTIDLT